MTEDLTNINALVTGAGSGIGLAIANALIEAGSRVVGTGRDNERLRTAAERLGNRFHPVLLDVTDLEQCESLPNRMPDAVDRIDVLINNAGHDVGGRRLFHEGDSREWTDIVDTNISGLMRVTHGVVPGMLQRDRGHVVNIGSVAGVYSNRAMTAYNASKFAVHGFSEALRKDLDDTDVRVTEILPGLVKTRFAENRLKGDAGAAGAFYAGFAAYLEPEDIARAVIYAISQPPHVSVSQLMIEPTRRGQG